MEEEKIDELVYEKIDETYSWAKYGDFDVITIMKGEYSGYINASKLCSNGKKEFKNWSSNSGNKNLIKEFEELSKNIFYSPKKYTYYCSNHGVKRGTYVHPDLIPHIAMWISPRFGLMVSFIIKEWRKQSEQNDMKYMDELGKCLKEASLESKENYESFYRDKIASEENGEIEVETDCGFIDVLTKTKVIEVKKASNWKHAIGQVICYWTEYEDLEKWIYLFDHQTADKEMIVRISGKSNVNVKFI